MRKSLLLGFGSLVAVAVLAAEVVISSLNPNGELTWTNSVSNATYRVEWGGSSTGPWNITTSTNPVLGTWRFDNPDPSFSGGHLLGDGTFTNAAISGNHLLIVIPATNQFFTLEGEMVGDSFAGLWRATGEAYYKGKGYFLARRKILPQTAVHRVGNNK